MFIENPGSTSFTIDLSAYSVVGFHATSAFAATEIERVGFLPSKILNESQHKEILEIARSLGIETNDMGGYEQWLEMMSVTFTKAFEDAINHVRTGRYEGQGVKHISKVLLAAELLQERKNFLDQVRSSINEIKHSNPVIYAVDLSNLGGRLVEPKYEDYYQLFWDRSKPMPKDSIVGPERLIARLDLSGLPLNTVL
jgi:hypothetical protein